ncbi:MAG: hypothetical protein M1591_10450 [Deltaproteobacteria bacterium]|nr:hypothetical protein [Deltaproteobacteria bacterium]
MVKLFSPFKSMGSFEAVSCQAFQGEKTAMQFLTSIFSVSVDPASPDPPLLPEERLLRMKAYQLDFT